MSLPKPIYRVIRPFTDGEYSWGNTDDEDYILSNDYASDRTILIRAYSLIERDVIRLFDYIEPSDTNLHAYSHRTYELLLRASTEFEANCKYILRANGYQKPKGSLFDVSDYWKINRATKLSEYKIVLETWHPNRKTFQPLKEWASGHTLGWYKSYNTVKHDRNVNFPEASLENVLTATTALLAILVAQFYVYAFNPYQRTSSYVTGDDNSIYVEGSLFQVLLPTTWASTDQYDFDWKALRATHNPFDKFKF